MPECYEYDLAVLLLLFSLLIVRVCQWNHHLVFHSPSIQLEIKTCVIYFPVLDQKHFLKYSKQTAVSSWIRRLYFQHLQKAGSSFSEVKISCAHRYIYRTLDVCCRRG